MQGPIFELRQLECFVAVAEREHVAQAAAVLGISQSPLSRQIRGLEARLGIALFERSRQRLRLTAEGRAFLAEARALLDHAAETARRARGLAAGETGSLAIAYVEGAMHAGVLPAALRAFAACSPGVRLDLERLRSGEQLAALARGSVDVGLLYTPEGPVPDGLVCTLVADEPFVLALPDDHALARRRRAPSAAELDGEPFVALPRRSHPEARERLLRACAEAGMRPDVRYEAAEPGTVLALVASGLGVAFVQSALARAPREGVAFREVAWLADRVRISVARREQAGPAARRLEELVLERSRGR